MSDDIQTIQEPLFLISPPGSLAARDIGYINVPKIFEAPPCELDEVYHYVDQTGFLEFPDESNFWVSEKHIALKIASFDLVVPIFPEILEYSIPWIVCEYGLYCVTENKLIDLKEFTKRTIKRRASDYEFVGQALFEKRWRKAKTPIPYLRTVIKRIKNESEQIETGTLFGSDPPILSLDEPLITGDPLVATKIRKDINLHDEIGLKNLDIDNAELIDCLLASCRASKISHDATRLLITQVLNTTICSDVARYLNYDEKKYDKTRREINRKQKELKKQIGTYYPHLLQKSTNSD